MKLRKWIRKSWIRVFEVIIIPTTILVVGIWLESNISYRQEDLVVTQMIDSYFDGITNHLISGNTEISLPVMVARSRALFNRLHQLDRKNEIIEVIRFLSESNPSLLMGDVFEQDPQSDRYFINFSGYNLSETDMSLMELEDVRFMGVNFGATRFYNFSCYRCGFPGSSFRNAEFSMASFSESDMKFVDFRGSNIDAAVLEGTMLEGAIWSDGRICAEGSIGACR